jgi:polyphosphate kinase
VSSWPTPYRKGQPGRKAVALGARLGSLDAENLDYRVEAAFLILRLQLRSQVRKVLEGPLADTVKARVILLRDPTQGRSPR